MEVRVRLEFRGDVGRHVQRHRGFSSCWYLVPNDAKLVGDLAYALQREFALRKRCPQGLELRLEELPVLATQSIRIVRDDDTIIVQCPLAEDVLAEMSSDSEETRKPKRRKRSKKQKKEEVEVVEEPHQKKIKRVQEVVETFQHRLSAEKKANEGFVGTKKSEDSSSSSSDSESSSESSSSSSSSSSESEDEPATKQSGKRKTSQVPMKKPQQTVKSNSVPPASNGVLSKADGSKQIDKQPRRRRRRLRQRNGRRPRDGNQEANAVEILTEKPTASKTEDNAAPSQEAPRKTPTVSKHLVNKVVGPRGYPKATAHVLFDEETGDQVAVQYGDDSLDIEDNYREDVGERNSHWAAQHSSLPELAKYGPPSSNRQQSRPVKSLDVVRNKNEESEDYEPEHKRKDRYEERWKRPYEILATVLNKTPAEKSSSNSSAPDLTKLLALYPTATAGSLGFELEDIIAFKTLTLCLETWQPVLSEWQCGQVQSIDASSSTIELSKWTLAASGNSVDFREATSTEQLSITTSEISELRFLSGPSHSSLQQIPN